ncbi:nuclear RNA export factor 1-like [Gouania willdenowi]|uniref:nuclear RNA export factor 1-like n=1 Tax=Gouania willdenowi TaxID=441366 RepID=UPI0010548958|nr:nuclear RNA export factor 1-like [Gouania willdenowi]
MNVSFLLLNVDHVITQGSCFGSDDAKVYIQHFLQQYYSVYDSGDRQSLLGAYHDEALFSITTPYNIQNPSGSVLREYFKDSRNLKRTKDSRLGPSYIHTQSCNGRSSQRTNSVLITMKK